MIGIQTQDMFLDFANTAFHCPNCKKHYDDSDDKYCRQINKNKSWITKIKCECNTTFKLTVDYKSDFVTFI